MSRYAVYDRADMQVSTEPLRGLLNGSARDYAHAVGISSRQAERDIAAVQNTESVHLFVADRICVWAGSHLDIVYPALAEELQKERGR